ncbi:MAG: hypothetical protein HY812_08135 [Planctomycetes bacterium]|nr:hypothetical protein [Planctomycetota bacterium]
MLRKSLCAAAAALLSSAACAETTVDIMFPPFVEPLAGIVVADVVANQIDVAGDELTIKQGETDVTSAVVQSESVVRAVDANGDGVYETFEHRYWLDLSNLSYDDTHLVLKAQVWNGGVETLILRGMAMISPATLGTGDTTWVSAVNGNVVPYYLRLQGGTVLDRATVVFMNGVDVTARAKVTETVIWDESNEGFIRDRMIRIDVDLPSIGFGAIGDRLELRSDIWFANRFLSVPCAADVEIEPSADAAKKERIANCVAAFVHAVNAVKANGETTIGSPEGVGAAADALDACLKACGMSSGSQTVTLSGGVTVMVGFGSVSGAADLVIALGSNGTGSNAGGSATAENTQPGGAAVANAGDGAAGSAAKGGEAKATSNGGDAVALGGAGGGGGAAGGPGGDATAENKVPGKTANAQGGAGGNPGGSDEPGGSGGHARGTTGKTGANGEGGPDSIGYHGTGAKVRVTGGQGQFSDGASVPNCSG